VNEQLKDTTVTEEETNPLFDLFAEEKSYSEQRPILFYIQEKDTALVRSYISSEKATASSAKKKYAKFLWGIKDKETDAYPLYAIKQTKSGKPVLSGAVVETAAQGLDYAGNPNVNLQMNEVGSKIWERMTAKASSEQSYIAIVVGEEVYSAPGVSHGPIKGGMSVISGNFTIEEAQDFANVLESGQIPKAELIHFDVDIFE